MLVIRLQRTGRENLPTYRIVVAQKSDPVKGKCKEIVGHYLPTREPPVLEVKEERVTHWVRLGAQPSDTVARILTKKGLKGLEKFMKPYVKRKPRKAAEEGEVAAAAPAAAASQAPAKTENEAKPAEEVKEGAKEAEAPAKSDSDSEQK